ncbi:MAG: sulfide:quinone oxidoreductase [Solirubrobacteraceae bacterium]|jgi:sulfide:quinone oxidoreductase|nr:sulfide:quinone oxidoreductase [Solirubrobacteraceae bacterium]
MTHRTVVGVEPPARWTSPVRPRRVLIAGGGIAGVEALMALADLGDRRLDVALIAPREVFLLRPQMVGEPWGGPVLRVDLARLCASFGATFRRASLTAVEPEGHVAMTSAGPRHFEELIVATGAVASVPYSGVHVLGFGHLPDLLGEEGAGDVAIIVPPATTWTLPAYELAVLVASGSHRRVRVLTPEHAPLEVFGHGPAAAVAHLLADHEIEVELGRTPAADGDAAELAAVVVTLPRLDGPRLGGLAHDAQGFLRVDDGLAVLGADDVHAAGDVIAGPIKQGGLAAQQAEAATVAIVRRAGGRPPHAPYAPVLRGKLTAADGSALYLRRKLDGLDAGEHRTSALWTTPGVVCAKRLARWLAARHPELDDGMTLDHVARAVVPGAS